MLIPLPELISKYNIRPIGVCHVGSSTLQEAKEYFNNGVRHVMAVEAIPEVFRRMKAHAESFAWESLVCINACITDKDGEEMNFKISSNDGESSSIYDFGTHAQMHPDVSFVDEVTLISSRLDTIIQREKIVMDKYNFLNVDLQGADLLAIKSLGDNLKFFSYAYVEVNRTAVYQGCALSHEVDTYMATFGFVPVETKWIDNQWGDCFFMKK